MIKRLPPALDSLRANLQFTRRSLLREPGYAVAFVITLCLGIGVNTATFSVVNGVLLRPLPYPEADRLVFLSQPAEQRGSTNIRFSLLRNANSGLFLVYNEVDERFVGAPATGREFILKFSHIFDLLD